MKCKLIEVSEHARKEKANIQFYEPLPTFRCSTSFWHYQINFNIHKEPGEKMCLVPASSVANTDTHAFPSCLFLTCLMCQVTGYKTECSSIGSLV